MKKIVVVDLDGCLCSINSFRFWLLFSFLVLFVTLRWVSLFIFLKSILFRVFGMIDRVQMKADVLMVTEDLPMCFISWFGVLLNLFTNEKVRTIIEQYRGTEQQIVLCTAAPSFYVNIYAARFPFSNVLASPSIFLESWVENIGIEKLARLKLFYGDNVAIESVLTDHHDDLPLLLIAKNRILVSPSEATLQRISGMFDFEVI